MPNVLDTLFERGFVQDTSNEAGLRQALEQPRSLYCGYDPSAPSFHIGNLVSMMMLAHFQQAGHRPIAVVGGGTGMVGDPSGKTTQRRIMSISEIEQNVRGLRGQLARYIDFEAGRALMLNNADWLLPLNYVAFLRDVGRFFSVNQMLAADAYKTRLETGLSFIEFNYMLLQAYDFLHLFRTQDCVLQIGGSDQWANCLAGADLIRRTRGADAFVLIAPLLTTAGGQKMGKTESGAVWLDSELTSPYEFYQYWINVDDRDVERFLALFTFLPMAEVRRLGSLEGADIRRAKEILALETTALTHGRDAAQQAQATSRGLFRRIDVSDQFELSETAEMKISPPSQTLDVGGIPSEESFGFVGVTRLPATRVDEGVPILELLVETGLAASRSAARRLILQGGAYLNSERVLSPDAVVTSTDLAGGEILLRAGKKQYHRIIAD